LSAQRISTALLSLELPFVCTIAILSSWKFLAPSTCTSLLPEHPVGLTGTAERSTDGFIALKLLPGPVEYPVIAQGPPSGHAEHPTSLSLESVPDPTARPSAVPLSQGLCCFLVAGVAVFIFGSRSAAHYT
jgi:hypothetical protein